jgi:hypothetical protein
MNSSMKDRILKYIITVGDALSQLINVTLFFSMNANQSLSSRCYESRDVLVFKYLGMGIDKVFSLLGEDNHCERAYKRDIVRCLLRCRRHELREGKA